MRPAPQEAWRAERPTGTKKSRERNKSCSSMPPFQTVSRLSSLLCHSGACPRNPIHLSVCRQRQWVPGTSPGTTPGVCVIARNLSHHSSSSGPRVWPLASPRTGLTGGPSNHRRCEPSGDRGYWVARSSRAMTRLGKLYRPAACRRRRLPASLQSARSAAGHCGPPVRARPRRPAKRNSRERENLVQGSLLRPVAQGTGVAPV